MGPAHRLTTLTPADAPTDAVEPDPRRWWVLALAIACITPVILDSTVLTVSIAAWRIPHMPGELEREPVLEPVEVAELT